MNKHPLSNARSRKNELKEVLPAILPGYIYQLVAPLLSRMEAYLLQVIENEDETSSVVQSPQSWEVGLKEENIPSEEKEKGESHGSHTQSQYDVTSLKEALAWVSLMQRNLSRTIGQMSPEEQLFFVRSVYSLNTALMVNQSLQQLQQSPVIPELAALLLGMGQPQPCQYEELCRHDYFPPIVNALSSTLAEHEIHFVDNPHVMEAIQALEAFPVLEESGSEDQQLSLDIMCPKFDKELSSDIIIFHFAAISPEKKKVLDQRQLKKLLGENRDGYKFPESFHTPDIFFDDRSDQEDLRKNLIPPTCTFAGFLEEKDERVEAIAQESEATSCMKYNSSLSSALDTEPKGVEKSLNKYCSTAATESEAELFTESKCDTKELPPAPLNTCPKNDIPLPDHSPTQWCWKTRLKRLSLKNIRYYLCKASQHSLEELDTECHETICHAVVSIPFTPEEAVSLLRILKSKELNVFTSCDKYGNVPLHIAVMKCNTEIVRELIRICPAAVKMTNHNGATPVDLAFGMRHSDIMDCLLNRAIEDDHTDPENVQLLQSLLPRAMKNGYTDYLRILLKLQSQYSLAIDFNCTDSDHHTASFYLQQQPPHVQEAVGMILNNSSIDPELQNSIRMQLLPTTVSLSTNSPPQFASDASGQMHTPPSSIIEHTPLGTIEPSDHTAELHPPDALHQPGNKPEEDMSKEGLGEMPQVSSPSAQSQVNDSLPSSSHAEETNPEEQSLPQLHSELQANLFPSDEGSGYSEDDEHIFERRKQHKRHSITRTASARNRHQARNGSSIFRPVGSGSSSSDHSTTSRRRSPVSQRQRGERKRAAERLQICRATASESESKGKETNYKTRYRQMLSKPECAEDDSSASDVESKPLMKLSDRDSAHKSESTATLKAKCEEASWSQSSDVQLSPSDASSQVYTHPRQCATDELLQVLEQQPESPMVTDNHQVKDRLDSSETLPMTECEKNHQTSEVLGEAIQAKAQSQQATWQTQNFQVASPPETEQGKSEECEIREQKDGQSATQESLEGFSQHTKLIMTVPVLQQNAWLPLPRIVPCAPDEHETLQPIASREEKSSLEQQEDSNCIMLRTQQHSTSKQSVPVQHEAVLTLGKGTFKIPQEGRQHIVCTEVSGNDIQWFQFTLKEKDRKYLMLLMLQMCTLYGSTPKCFCQPTCPTEGLKQGVFLQSEQAKPITACVSKKSPKCYSFDMIATCDPKKSPKRRSFDRVNFKYTVTQLIRDYSFSVFRRVVPNDLHFLFGLSPWRGQALSRLQKRQFSVVLKVAQCNRSAIPADVKQNLDDLAMALAMACASVPRVITATDTERGGGGEKKSSKGAPKGKASKQNKTKKETAATKTVDSSQTAESGVFSSSGTKSKGASAMTKLFGTKHDSSSKALSDQREKPLPSNTQVAHSLNPQDKEKLKKGKSNTEIEEWEPLVQQSSTDQGALHFANSNHPVEVLRDHFTTYSKCCPRHDIQNIVVIASTCPASEALGPKRRYSSIKDLRKEERHSQLNLSSSLSREDRSGATQPLPQQNQMVMADSPVTATRHKEVSMATLATETAAGTMPGPAPKPTPTAEGAPSLSQRLIERGPFHTHDQGLHTANRSGTHGNRGSNADSHSHHPFLQPLSSWHPCSAPPSSRTFCDISQYSLSVAEQREHKDRIRTAAELLHAQDYQRIFSLSYEGRPPPNLPPEIHVAYVFVTGLAYYKLGNNKDSLSYFQQCLRLAEEYGREGDVTLSCIYIGDIEFAQRNYLAASEQYQRALHRYSRDTVARDFRMILPTQSALCAKRGSALKNASKVVDAIAAYEEAIARAESKKDKLSAHTSLGNLFQSVGENARAVTEYEHSIQLATDLQDFVSLGWAHGNMGNAYLGLYQRDKALHHLEKSLDLTVEHEPTPQAIGRAYNNLGTAYQSLNELEKAEEYYDLSLSQAIYGNDIPGQARVYGNIGNLLMIKKECDRAVPHYTEVLRLSQDKSTVSTARHNRGCAYYEWAESKKKNFLQRDAPSTAPTATKPLFRGPQFEDYEPENRPPFIPKSIEKYYVQGTKDLDFVIKHHEESLHSIKGSPKGLSLSVSLFETNSRTFHRKQDCLVNMGKFEEALLTAEQSRARTLGELLLKRRGPQLEQQLTSPPSLEQLKAVVARQDCPVVYLSYTGARLLGWVFCPSPSQPSLNMFEVPLSDSEFDGKSFDYHLRYSLNEALVEKSFEMYKPFKYDEDQNDPVLKLYDLVAQPVMTMLRKLKKDAESADHPPKKAQKIIIIPDSYTNLLPMTCLLDRSEDNYKFWGDDHYFQIMPSLLTMGILDQLPTVSVSVPVEHQQMLCVVGNPTIPMFTYNGEEWNLGKLPHATKEAEWVSHILNCTPILHEQATKNAVMMRLMNAKVIHLATHGSAVAGFLAFAGMSSSLNETVDAKQVLIYPDEIEGLSITPALVVLSSCDSGRGVVKADGIQGMARAFILAGAQAVLTTLWRVPDESACVFMQFFYQFLVDGLRGTEALHKAILSVRCFSKYSQYIHWSGYQLTGREIQFSINRSSYTTELTARLGNHSIFPQLEIVKQLETAFLNNPRLPTDVQVLLCCH